MAAVYRIAKLGKGSRVGIAALQQNGEPLAYANLRHQTHHGGKSLVDPDDRSVGVGQHHRIGAALGHHGQAFEALQ